MDKEIKWLLNEKYNGVTSEEFERDRERLAAGEPLGYVIGWVPFLRTKIYLDSRPLIPRTETEYWVEKAIKEIQAKGIQNPKILDLCAGSGCIGVAILNALPDATVDFAEIDESHHETIRKNVRENNISENRTRIFGGDLFEQLSDRYDVILTNPPYIDPKEINGVQSSVLGFEPSRALFGGINGMEIIERIIGDAPQFLKPGGILVIEHEPEQESLIQQLLPGITSHKDQFGVIRFSIYKKKE